MEAPKAEDASTIKNKGIIKLKKEKREVGFLYTNKQRALLQ